MCPDRLFYRATDGEIGIVVRDFVRNEDDEGPESFVTMRFCPFCATALPLSTSRGDDPSGGDPLRRIDLGWPDGQ